MKHNLLFVISKIHIVEDHIPLKFNIVHRLIFLMNMFPCPFSGSVVTLCQRSIGAFRHIYKGYISLISFLCFVHQSENTLCSRHGHNHCVQLHTDLIDRHGKTPVKRQEAGKTSQSKPANFIQSQHSSDDGTEYITDVSKLCIDRSQIIGKRIGPVRADKQFLIEFPEFLFRLFFMTENLNDLLSLHHFFNISVHLTDINLLFYEISSAGAGGSPGRQYHNSDHNQGHNGQRNIQNDHADQNTHDRNSTVDKLRHTLADHLTKRINIIGID